MRVSSVLFAMVLFGWFSMEPSNNREWQADVAVLPHAAIEGNQVTVYNVRNSDLVNRWTVARHGRPCFQVVSPYLIQNWTVKMPTY